MINLVGSFQSSFHRVEEVNECGARGGREAAIDVYKVAEFSVSCGAAVSDAIDGSGCKDNDTGGTCLVMKDLKDVFVPFFVCVRVPAVVHAEHDGDNRGFEVKDVASEAGVDVARNSAEDVVTTDTGIIEIDGPLRITGVDSCLKIGGVEALRGDAVAEEDDAVAIVEREVGGRLCDQSSVGA
jgi:hypothetical protein